jgi:hypothetical protein
MMMYPPVHQVALPLGTLKWFTPYLPYIISLADYSYTKWELLCAIKSSAAMLVIS